VIEDLVPKLSGLNHMKVFHKTEYASIVWIQEHTGDNSVILEAIIPNDPYSGRISGYSARPTVLNSAQNMKYIYGPKVSLEIDQRAKDIDKIYKEKDKKKIKDLIKKYNIEYIYIGELENKLYEEESLEVFKDIATLMFNFSDEEKTSLIYKIN
jgi:uncharacterized membrane protein